MMQFLPCTTPSWATQKNNYHEKDLRGSFDVKKPFENKLVEWNIIAYPDVSVCLNSV